MAPANRVQAGVPVGAQPIDNACGTAPGLRARLNDAEVVAMPGVPDEMRSMFQGDVLPRIEPAQGGAAAVQNTLHTIGVSESEIGEKIGDLMERGRNPTVGTSAAELIISIRIVARADAPDEAAMLLDSDAAEIRRRLGDAVFGEADETLATAVGRLFIERRKTVAVAESCTGGLLAKRLTDVPGSSVYFKQGFVTYSNESKSALLGVAPEQIERHGAVSRQVAEALVIGCRDRAGTDLAVAITGIAGPAGGSPEKPVGLVFVGLADRDGVRVFEHRLGEQITRGQVRDRTVKIALNRLRLGLLPG